MGMAILDEIHSFLLQTARIRKALANGETEPTDDILNAELNLQRLAKKFDVEMPTIDEVKSGMVKAIDEFDGEYRFLSNFFVKDMTYKGVVFPSAEHAYHWEKTHDPDEKEKIKQADSPAAAKKLGRKVNCRDDWNSVKIDIMRTIVAAKFADPELAAKLLETGKAELVEGNWWGDTFWGVCKGTGQNWLGKLLMETREGLKNEQLREVQETDR